MVENIQTEGKYYPEIVVSNVFALEKEIQPYMDLAKRYGYEVISLIVEKRHENIMIHNIPEKSIIKMESQLKNSIKLR